MLEAFNEKYEISLNAIKSLKDEYDNNWETESRR
jgi:hypothetical protein